MSSKDIQTFSLNSNNIQSLSKCLNVEPIEVIEPYNPQIVEFKNVDDFNIYYNANKQQFDMTTQKLNAKYKIPGYKLTKKNNILKLIKDYHKTDATTSNAQRAHASDHVASSKGDYTKTDSTANDSDAAGISTGAFKALQDRVAFLEKQIEHITAFLSNM